jgi:hypothetical protein
MTNRLDCHMFPDNLDRGTGLYLNAPLLDDALEPESQISLEPKSALWLTI